MPVLRVEPCLGGTKRVCCSRVTYGLLLFLMAWLTLGPVPATAAIYRPRSTIDRPLGPGSIFLLGHRSTGGTRNYDSLAGGWGGCILMRPNAAADFLGPLYDWNTGAVAQYSRQNVGQDRHIVAVEGLLRRYLGDMRSGRTGHSCFVGAGLGVCKAVHPGGRAKWFSWPVECGWERSFSAGWIIEIKAQFRYFNYQQFDYTGWTAHVGAGIPLPW